MVDAGEECDDGNLIDHDACTNACTAATCGDGILQDGEECDDGNDDLSDDCPDCHVYRCGDGFLHVSEACDDGNDDQTDDCADCVPATCGDGIIHAGVEDCDGTALGGETCLTQGFMGGTLACDARCMLDTSMCCETTMMC